MIDQCKQPKSRVWPFFGLDKNSLLSGKKCDFGDKTGTYSEVLT